MSKKLCQQALEKICQEIAEPIRLSTAIIKDEPTDCKQLSFGFFMLATALYAICYKIGWLGSGVIALVDSFMIFLIIATAIRSTNRTIRSTKRKLDNEKVFPYFPTRPGALILFLILLSALIVAFGSVYLWIGEISRDHHIVLMDWGHALFFSTITMTTLGAAGEHAEGVARIIVVCEIFSGITMLVVALPLLVGRLVMWGEEEKMWSEKEKRKASKAVTVKAHCCPAELIVGFLLGVAVSAVAAAVMGLR